MATSQGRRQPPVSRKRICILRYAAVESIITKGFENKDLRKYITNLSFPILSFLFSLSFPLFPSFSLFSPLFPSFPLLFLPFPSFPLFFSFSYIIFLIFLLFIYLPYFLVESIDIETTNYSKTTRIWPHNMLLWLPEITIDRGHSPKAHSPKADSEHRHLHIQHF